MKDRYPHPPVGFFRDEDSKGYNWMAFNIKDKAWYLYTKRPSVYAFVDGRKVRTGIDAKSITRRPKEMT